MYYKLTQEQLTNLVNFLNDQPFKFATPVINLLNTLEKVEEQVAKEAKPKKK